MVQKLKPNPNCTVVGGSVGVGLARLAQSAWIGSGSLKRVGFAENLNETQTKFWSQELTQTPKAFNSGGSGDNGPNTRSSQLWWQRFELRRQRSHSDRHSSLKMGIVKTSNDDTTSSRGGCHWGCRRWMWSWSLDVTVIIKVVESRIMKTTKAKATKAKIRYCWRRRLGRWRDLEDDVMKMATWRQQRGDGGGWPAWG